MKKKIVWLGVSWLIVAALVLASCSPGAPEGEEEEEEEEEEIPTLSVGETFQTSEVVVTVSELIMTDSYEYYDEASESTVTEEADSGTYFLFLTIEMKNVGTTWRRYVGVREFTLTDSEGNTYRYLYYQGEDDLGTLPSLYPGDELNGKLLYNIPEGTSGLKILYSPRTPPAKPERAEWVIE